MLSVFAGSGKNLNSKTTEIIVSIIIVIFVTTIVAITIDPVEIIKKTRDTKRVDELNKLASALEKYRAENDWRYPESLTQLSRYISPVPKDSKTKLTYGYKVNDNNTEYELNANLESQSMQKYEVADNGDNDNLYEVGTNLSLIKQGLFNNKGENPPPSNFVLMLPKDQEKLIGRQNNRNCVFSIDLEWSDTSDPGDNITYYYYIDDSQYFANPEITGNTQDTKHELSYIIDNILCTDINQDLYWTVVAKDSGGNTTQSNTYSIELVGK